MSDDLAVRRLMARLGAAMVATGAPVDEVEDEVAELGAHLGYPSAQVAAGPTSIQVALFSGEPATVEAIHGELRLDQAGGVRELRHRVLADRIGVDEAERRLDALRLKPALYPQWSADVGFVAIAAGIGMILQPGLANVVAAALCGAVVAVLVRFAEHHPSVMPLLPTLASFIVAVIVLQAAEFGLLDGALRTILPPLAVLLPGALLVTGLSELSAGAMVAGSSRLLYGAVRLLLFGLGIAAAAAVLGVGPEALENLRVHDLGIWAAPVGLLLIGAGIAAAQSIPLKLVPWVIGVLALTLVTQLTLQQVVSAPLGSFAGAVVASLGSRGAEALRRDLPRLVVFLPSFWLLVPGSLGLAGVSEVAVGRNGTGLVEVVAVVLAITTGLLTGAVLARLFRRARRRVRRVFS